MQNHAHKVKHLLDSTWGAYIPSRFITAYDADEWNIRECDKEVLSDPDHELYWDTWDCVVSEARYKDSSGFCWTLYQDDALFAIREDLLLSEWEEMRTR